ncbi:pickpocket 3 [Carabus blaptoides fortunei]
MATHLRSALRNAQEYCEISSIHGLSLIVAKKRHILERLFWIIIVVLAVIGVIGLCLSNWQRYVENPTVVSLEKDFRNWHNPFPAATGCFVERADEDLVSQYIHKQWNIELSDDRYSYYVDFIRAVSNVSYETMGNFTRFQGDKTLLDVDLLDLAMAVHPALTGELVTFDVKRKSVWDVIVTEYGICFTTNSQFSNLFLAKKVNETNMNDDFTLECHYLNGLCYARYDSDPYLAIKYFVHSPFESIHTTTAPPLLLPEKAELEINYRMQETRPADSLRRLSVSQRQCRFLDEPISGEIPVYSTSICHMLCRYHYAMRVCGCKPFFYHTLGGKICDVNGMVCLAKHTEHFAQSASKMGCNCLEPCRVITYFAQIPKMTEWVAGYFDQRVTFRWGLLHPTTRYYRDVLFGFEDLVVAFGGTASLFFGMSFLSLVEFVFFVIKKWITHVYNKISKRGTEIQLLNDKQNGRRIEKADKMFTSGRPIPVENPGLENISVFSERNQYANRRITSVGITAGIPYFN